MDIYYDPIPAESFDQISDYQEPVYQPEDQSILDTSEVYDNYQHFSNDQTLRDYYHSTSTGGFSTGSRPKAAPYEFTDEEPDEDSYSPHEEDPNR